MDSLMPAAHAIAERLKARKETIAVSESSTGGLISAVLLAVPGASAYFMGGGVIYTRPAHQAFLNVPAEQLKGIRSSSEPYALLNARTIRERLATSWGLAETGASGPTGNRYGDAAGHTCYAVVGSGIERVATLETGSDDRVANMRRFAAAALQLLHDQLR
jgi:PncC family amidohydrolase